VSRAAAIGEAEETASELLPTNKESKGVLEHSIDGIEFRETT